jgi:fucose permease
MVGSWPAIAVTISGACIFGLVLALLGSIRKHLARQVAPPEGRGETLWGVLNLSLPPMILLSGFLLDGWEAHAAGSGVRSVMILGSVLTAFSLFALTGQSRSYGLTLFLLLVAGLGGALISTSSIVLMPRAFFGLDEASASLNIGNVFFALGALLAPALVDVLLRLCGFRATLTLLALLCLGPALAAFLTRPEEVALVDPKELDLLRQRATLLEVLLDPVVLTAALVFFFYAPLEGSITHWASQYLVNQGHDERSALWYVTGFWSAFLTSRLLAAFLQHRRWLPPSWDAPTIVILAILAAAVIGNLIGTIRRRTSTTGIVLLGFLFGPIFPTLVGILFRQEREQQGTAYGMMFALGSVGSLVLTPLISALARRTTVRSALWIPLLLALLLMSVSVVLALVLRT